jgi:hypothetical protein
MKKYILFFIFSISFVPTFSQTEDLGSWMTFSFNKGLGDKFALNLDQELRFKDNLSNFNLVYTNLGCTYKVTSFLKVATVYRFIDKQKGDGSYGIRNRLYTDFAFKIKPKKWSLRYRLRLQSEWRTLGYNSDLANVPEVYIRNLFKIGYKFSYRISPYIGAELRWQLQNPRLPWGNGFDRSRFLIGSNYNINNKMTLGTYFLYQKEWNRSDPQTLYIIGLEFGISIN